MAMGISMYMLGSQPGLILAVAGTAFEKVKVTRYFSHSVKC